MRLVPFRVDDASLREQFDKVILLESLGELTPDTKALWGRMTAQQMVEHLEWTYGVSTGKNQVECRTPEGQRSRMKRFLYSSVPTPRDFANPVLTDGLPRLKNANLAGAIDGLRQGIELFWSQAAENPGELHTHPLFGPIAAEEWSRTHFKHGCHHLMQFGLIQVE